MAPTSAPTVLSQREREALRFVASGRSSTQIAAEMRVATCTVETFIASAMRKLGAGTRRQAALLAAADARPPTSSLARSLGEVETGLLTALASGASLAMAGRAVYVSERTATRRLAGARQALGVQTTTEALVAWTRMRNRHTDAKEAALVGHLIALVPGPGPLELVRQMGELDGDRLNDGDSCSLASLGTDL